MSNKNEADDRLAPLLEYFAERLNRVYAHFFCVLEFNEAMHDSSRKGDRIWVINTIQNACTGASLIAIRDLDDFLTPRTPKSRPDDLRASDFGYLQSRGFLNGSERGSINKHIAHATTSGAHSEGFRWDIWELTSKCVAQCFEFLKWVEAHYGLSHFSLFTAALVCRTKTLKTHEYVAAKISEQTNQK